MQYCSDTARTGTVDDRHAFVYPIVRLLTLQLKAHTKRLLLALRYLTQTFICLMDMFPANMHH